MKTVKVQPNQNVFDLAVQHYGNVEAVDEILQLNPGLKNEAAALRSLQENIKTKKNVFYMEAAVEPGFLLTIDETSKLRKTNTLRKIDNKEITTYETYESWQRRLNPSKTK